ncbi:hypothetical protein, partial [Spiribacter roseus]|uniref:hypothetical protein n=1 Tax=Spiribacter roseus TaxID=1855875 RepID=UPI001330072F
GTVNLDLGDGIRNISVTGEPSSEETVNVALTEGGNYSGTWSGFGGSDELSLTADADITGISSTGGELGGLTTVDIGGETLTATAVQVSAITDFSANGGTVDATGLADNSTVNLGNVTNNAAGKLTLGASDVTLDAGADLGDFAVELANDQSLTAVTASQLSDSGGAGREILTGGDGTGTAVGLDFGSASSPVTVDAANWSADLGGVNFVDTNTQALTLNNLSVDSGTALDFTNLSDGSATVDMSDGSGNALAYAYDASGDTINYDVAASGDAWDA